MNGSAKEVTYLIYDADCGFCTHSIAWISHRLRFEFRAVSYQSTDLRLVGLSEQDAQHKAWFIDEQGNAAGGHLAFAGLFAHEPYPWPVVAWALRTPPMSWAARLGYTLIARNRHRIPWGTCTVHR